jgi:predicted transposase YbfD/YdcC
MDANVSRGALRFFNDMEDPRKARGKRHKLADMIAIAICASVCGEEGWVDIALFGKVREKWFRTFLELPRGIPSHDTFGRLFAKLDPDALERCFVRWMAHLAEASDGRLVAIDGKALRRSFDTAAEKTGVHLLSAWCTANEAVLGQVACDVKSNEITAMPKLLELLDLKGAVVSADAMHCQRQTAEDIVEKGGDYLLQVKDNQRSLHENLQLLFAEGIRDDCLGVDYDFAEDVTGDHGRIETRRCWTTGAVEGLAEPGAWRGLGSAVCVERIRRVGDQESQERAYYMSSLPGTDAAKMLALTRGHWKVENQLHWSLDVVFREDDCRTRKGHAAENHSRLRRVALNLLKADSSRKLSLRAKRKVAGWDIDYLMHLLTLGDSGK